VVLRLFLPFAVAALACAAAPLPAQPAAQADMAGTWDLTWQTRHGPERKGYLVVRQTGALLAVEIHGQGSVRAKGALTGHSFIVRGSRMLVPYTISGRVEGARLTGTLKIMSIERRFSGARR
jgi:hypothetical protein